MCLSELEETSSKLSIMSRDFEQLQQHAESTIQNKESEIDILRSELQEAVKTSAEQVDAIEKLREEQALLALKLDHQSREFDLLKNGISYFCIYFLDTNKFKLIGIYR
jgi:predicted RNase H-like nuclease (RuvC/YqgF family)